MSRIPRLRPYCWIAAILPSLMPACSPQVATQDLPSARETMASVGKRLGQAKAPGELTEAAKKSARVLKLLTASERDALGRNAIRFKVDQPTTVDVAALAGFEPFWLADQGFVKTSATFSNEDGTFTAYRKTFPPGVVGLGVNSLDRASPTHYTIFARGANGSPPSILALEPSILNTVAATEGASPFLDAMKPIRALPPELKGSLIVQTSHEDRHDGLLATGRVWKARQPSSPKPDQVVVSFGNKPARQLSFTWRTDPSVKNSSLRIQRDSDPGSVRTLVGDFHPIASHGLLNDPTIHRHRVLADQLEPDTTYVYSVGDGTESGWSEWQRVKTAPESLRDFGFLSLGDAQCGLEKWGELLHRARKHRPDAGFLLLAGDLVDRGNERTNWDHFFLRAAGVFEGIPFMPAVGNHEYLDEGPKIYAKTFDLPKNGPAEVAPNLVYSFEYSDALFAVLDSTIAIHDSTQAKVQAEWLDRTLSETRATWKFVTFHHPVYASHVSRENPELGAAWGPIFDKHHVDMVLQGHDHAYLRTRPMFQGKPVGSPAEGTVYVVSVSGEKFYEQNPRDYTSKGMTNTATYQTIDIQVKEKRLTYRSFDRDGHEVDQLVIDKSSTTNALASDRAGLPLR